MTKTRAYSVIIPLYNKETFVKKTIDSILNQTYPNFEIIVVDDGSTDNSVQIIKSFKDERIRIIQQQNQGVSTARNRGIKEAKYEMIALIDADDWWDKDYLKIIDILVNKYPNTSIFGAKFAYVKNGVSIPSTSIFDKKKDSLTFDLINVLQKHQSNSIPINSSNTVFKRTLLEKSGDYDPRIHYYEDLDLFLRMAQFSNVAFFNKEPLSFYCREGLESQRASGKIPHLEKHILGHLEKFNTECSKNNVLSNFLARFVLDRLLVYVEHNTELNEVKKILKQVNKTQYTWKHKLYYSFSPISFLLIKANLIRRQLTKKNS